MYFYTRTCIFIEEHVSFKGIKHIFIENTFHMRLKYCTHILQEHLALEKCVILQKVWLYGGSRILVCVIYKSSSVVNPVCVPYRYRSLANPAELACWILDVLDSWSSSSGHLYQEGSTGVFKFGFTLFGCKEQEGQRDNELKSNQTEWEHIQLKDKVKSKRDHTLMTHDPKQRCLRY